MEALLIPWVLLLVVILDAVCLIKRWWKAGVVIAIVLLLVNWHWNVFSVGFNSLDKHKNPNYLRVMTWNISCADTTVAMDVDGLVAAIQRENPDMIFITEYGRHLFPVVDSLLCNSFPYRGGIENWRSWSDFYSHVPIDSCYMVETERNGCVLRYNVRFSDSRLRLYCTHLQSTNLLNNESFYPDSIQDGGSAVRYLKNYQLASDIRGEQANMTVDDFDDAPIIVLGDMNDVAGSHALSIFMESGLRDAWWVGGLGYGATIHEPLPYRIDHILYSSGLQLKGVKKVNAKGLSDHDALVADFEIK